MGGSQSKEEKDQVSDMTSQSLGRKKKYDKVKPGCQMRP